MLIAAGGTFFAVLLLIAAYLPVARRLHQFDRPSGRSAHDRPVVSSGGVAITGGLLVMLLFAAALDVVNFAARENLALLAATVFCLIGFVDDRRNLSVGLRLGVFSAISVLVSIFYPGTGELNTVPAVAQLAATALALLWLINLFNFMDGIDGIAALQCALVAAALAMFGWLHGEANSFAVVAVAVAAAYAAFLCVNWPPARVFMGDAGSLSGGFCLGWLGLWAWVDGLVNPFIWFVLMSPFLLDTGYTLALRLWRGERITEAHNTHIYQRLARHWKSHRRVDLMLLALHFLWLIPLSLAIWFAALSAPLALALALLPQLILIAKATAFE